MSVDAQGRPLHSWRVLILPFLDENALYEQLDLTKPWDDPRNRGLLENMPLVFSCPSDPQARGNTTNYVGVFGRKCIFHGSRPTKFRDIKNGTANTVMVGESSRARIHWARPVDIDVELHTNLVDADGFGGNHVGGCHFLFADGAVRFITDNTDADTLRRMFEMHDGRQPPPVNRGR